MSDAEYKTKLEEFMSQLDQRENSRINKIGGAILEHVPFLKEGHNKRVMARSGAHVEAVNRWDALSSKELIQQRHQEIENESKKEIQKAETEEKRLASEKKRLESLRAMEEDALEKKKIQDQINDINTLIEQQQDIINRKVGQAVTKIEYKI